MEVFEVNIKLLLPVLFFIFSLYGGFHYINNHESNMCEMTYMFEYPEYLRIPLKYEVMKQFPRYKLYVYGEGKYFEELQKDRFTGNPVLFIPGNAGSHRQVRSLASVALRMAHSLHTTMFNFFAIDFNEEISGLYGGTLDDQTEFVYACIKRIQSLYSSEKKLILIGHSMGGVISKAVFSLPSFDPADISLILTLAAPHKQPVVTLDFALVNFYAKIKETWKYRLKKGLMDIPIISIGGGHRDILVRSDLTTNHFQHKSSNDIEVLTASIPGVWVSTDHLAIVWCKQLVLTIIRTLYDLNNKVIKQNYGSNTGDILRHHFISRSSGTYFPQIPSAPVSTFTTSGQWIEQESNTWRFSRSKVLSTIYLLIPVRKDSNVLVVASGIVKREWIFGCTLLSGTETKTCAEAENLSEKSEIIPNKGKKSQRRLINLDSQYLQEKKYPFILIYITPLDSQVDILGERYNTADRTKYAKLPSVLQRFFSPPSKILSVSLPEQSIFFNITIPQSYGVFDSVEFQLETRLCRAGSVVGQGIIKTYIPGSNENSYHHIRTVLGGVTSIPIKTHFLPHNNFNHDVNLQLILDPECSVVLTAKFPLNIIANQFMKFYGIYVIGYTVALLLAYLAGQMNYFESFGSFPSYFKVFGQYPTYVTLVGIPSVLYHVILDPELDIPVIPPADRITQDDNRFVSTLILRTLLYLIACGLIAAIYTVFALFLKGISKFWIWIKHKTIFKVTEVPLEQTFKSRIKISKLLLVWCAFIGAVSVQFSSSLGAICAFIFYFLKLISDYIRCAAEEERRGPGVATTKWHFHFTLVLLSMCTTALVFPGMIAWVKGLQYSFQVPNDPYTFPCVSVVLSCALLWQLPSPSFNRVAYKKCSYVVHIIATLVTLYGIHSVYRLLYFICFTFIIICIQQTNAFLYGFPVKGD
ncbi:GPI inositol-deacylase [Trichonephila inaurata madagascariensis]|uniref:GPI inositol-deacylase n=1 Tax=Trichonephila inaurata madagascariensis TaxID=2747483 RepID=A0A8X6XQ30_9ARAC|nr:GPI inositol-deacylase [Trichonephila inaurata madagascariensis]